jgi:transposase
MRKIAYVGIDYYLHSLSIAVLIEGDKEPDQMVHLKNDDHVIRKFMSKISEKFQIKACYEASTNGYCFQRKMASWGYHCDVIAPSLIPRKPGDHRKNDFRDARTLVQNYAHDMLSIIHLPSEEEEAVRSLVRCRYAFKEMSKRVKQQINSFLLGQDQHWKHSKWTHQHRTWLGKLKMSNPHSQQVLEEHLAHLDYLETRLRHLDAQVEEMAVLPLYAPAIKKLCALKGIQTLTAMLLIAEITDFRRFPTPRALMAFLGLIPSEDCSGDKRKGGAITKAGNHRCRTALIEAVQSYAKSPRISTRMKSALSQVDALTAAIAMKCLKRLHKRFWALTLKGKLRSVAITAIARELVGFIWAMLQTEPSLA